MPIIYLTISEAAECAGVERTTIYRWIRKGTTCSDSGELLHLVAVIIAGKYRIEESDFHGFLDSLGYEYEEESEESDDSGENRSNGNNT